MNVLVVHCHPDPESFGAACRDAVLDGLARGGHEVRLLDLYAMDFRPELSAEEWRRHGEGWREDDVAPHVEAIRWASALVVVYPTWWGMQPAMLRGWFDRVLAPGVAFDFSPRGRLRGRLRNIRRVVIVTTGGSPWSINAVQGQAGYRVVGRVLRPHFHPFCRIRRLALYGLDHIGDVERRAFLDEVEDKLARPGL